MKNILLVSTSLNPGSRSRKMLKIIEEKMQNVDLNVDFVDLMDYELPFCDGRHPLSEYGESAVKLDEKIKWADAYVFGMAVYCYSISGVFKNMIDICCGGMANKPFGIAAASGGTMSYMAVEDLQKILSFEVRSIAYPRVVFAANEHWDKDGKRDEGLMDPIPERIDEFVESFSNFIKKI
ncbi:hypothetical protein CL643_00580 [bacterium]|nr:hypothetical protein [bacterium]|tara:strand:- start:5870 stop:6409 length:540 start_codon:yes stop_codon:yes gene_type:complete